jgi:hypothetical protein
MGTMQPNRVTFYSLTVLLIVVPWLHRRRFGQAWKDYDSVIVVFGGIGSILAIVVVIAVIGAINGWTEASERQRADETYWRRQREIAEAMNRAAEDHTRAVGTGEFVEGSMVTVADPIETVRVLRRG